MACLPAPQLGRLGLSEEGGVDGLVVRPDSAKSFNNGINPVRFIFSRIYPRSL